MTVCLELFHQLLAIFLKPGRSLTSESMLFFSSSIKGHQNPRNGLQRALEGFNQGEGDEWGGLSRSEQCSKSNSVQCLKPSTTVPSRGHKKWCGHLHWGVTLSKHLLPSSSSAIWGLVERVLSCLFLRRPSNVSPQFSHSFSLFSTMIAPTFFVCIS